MRRIAAGLLCVGFASSCGGQGSSKPPAPDGGSLGAAPGTSVPSSTPKAAATFPWPSNLPPATDATCTDRERQVREGVALIEDVDFVARCVAERVPPEEFDKFTASYRAFRDSEPFKAVETKCLPDDLRARVPAEQKRAAVFLSAAAQGPACLHAPEKQLPFGSRYRGLCIPWVSRGHYDATHETVTSMGPAFSATARAIVADASQDPDVFEWLVMAAHGQTPDSAARPEPGDSKQAFVSWVRGYVDKAAEACERPDGIREALYWVGYSVHALEDLAPHRGRTNPEHAFNAAHGRDPDADPAAYDLAKDIVYRTLTGLLNGRLKHCANGFASYDGAQVSYGDKVKPPFNRKRDFTVESLSDYKKSAAIFAKVQKEDGVVVRWFGKNHTPKTCAEDADCLALIEQITKDPP